MSRPPRPAALLGYALVLPVLFGAATEILMTPEAQAAHPLTDLFLGYGLLIDYAAVLLVFLSGALLGFAGRADPPTARAHLLAATPAAYAFFVWGIASTAGVLIALALGFLATLLIDRVFAADGLAPAWWPRLQLTLKGAAAAALLVAATI